jgi:hypothetical protein
MLNATASSNGPPAPRALGLVTLTPTGRAHVEHLVDRVLGREAELISDLTRSSRPR